MGPKGDPKFKVREKQAAAQEITDAAFSATVGVDIGPPDKEPATAEGLSEQQKAPPKQIVVTTPCPRCSRKVIVVLDENVFTSKPDPASTSRGEIRSHMSVGGEQSGGKLQASWKFKKLSRSPEATV